MQIPKAEEIRIKIQSDTENGIVQLTESCIIAIASMTSVNTSVSVSVDDGIPDFAVLGLIGKLRAEGWIVSVSDYGDADIARSRYLSPRRRSGVKMNLRPRRFESY